MECKTQPSLGMGKGYVLYLLAKFSSLAKHFCLDGILNMFNLIQIYDEEPNVHFVKLAEAACIGLCYLL